MKHIVLVLCLSLSFTFAGVGAPIMGFQDAALAAAGISGDTELCLQDGYASYMRADASQFKSVGRCVSYVAQGGTLYRIPSLTVQPPSFPTCQEGFALDTPFLYDCSPVADSSAPTCDINYSSGVDFLTNCVARVTGAGLQPSSPVTATLNICFTFCTTDQFTLGLTDANGNFSGSTSFDVCFPRGGNGEVLNGNFAATTDIGTTITADLPTDTPYFELVLCSSAT